MFHLHVPRVIHDGRDNDANSFVEFITGDAQQAAMKA